MRKILFLTTLTLATNPRLYKEIQLALHAGYQVELICFDFNNWSRQINDGLKQQLGNIKIIMIPAGRNPFFRWCLSATTETMWRFFGKFFLLPVPVLSQAISRRSSLLIQALNKASKPDLVIGHNPGAMWPAIKAAQKFNCRVGFDVEDYHPGEGMNMHLQTLSYRLMAELLPKMDYVSFAAPMILQEVKANLDIPAGKWFTVLNYFPASEFSEPANNDNGPVKLVWFSQNIGHGRGLPLIMPFIESQNGAVELHLIGNLNRDFYENYLSDIPHIIIHAPMKQVDLHKALAQFDIGLALDAATDKNRDLVVANKLLACLQSGLFVIAARTKATEAFLKEWPGHGVCFDHTVNNQLSLFEKVISGIHKIRKEKNERFINFRNNNWEAASLQLLTAWSNNV